MKTIREIALEVAKKEWFAIIHQPTSATTVEVYPAPHSESAIGDFAESVLAAYLAQQEPVAYVSKHYGIQRISDDDSRLQPGIQLFLAPPIPAGYQLVPVEPTEAILNVMYDNRNADPDDGDLTITYKAMLNAAKED